MDNKTHQEQDDKVLKIVRKLLEQIHRERHSGKASVEIDCYDGNMTNKKVGLVWCER